MNGWLRWHHGTCADPKWRLIAQKADATIPEVLAVWACILEAASDNTPRGTVHDVDPELIEATVGVTECRVTAIVTAMRGRVIGDGGELLGWRRRQYDDATNAERQRRFRNANKGLTDKVTEKERYGTQSNEKITPPEQNRPDQSRAERAPQSPPRPAREPAAAAAAAPESIDDAMQAVEDAEQARRDRMPPVQVRSLADWLVMHPRAFTRDCRAEWQAAYDRGGWDVLTEVYDHLAKTKKDRRSPIFLREVVELIDFDAPDDAKETA